MKSKHALIALFVLALALLLAACGGASGGGDAGQGDAFEVSVKDEFTFQPDVLKVKAGEEVKITFKNTGSAPHSFVILNKGVLPDDVVGASEEEGHEMLVMEMHEVAAGQSSTETFTAPTEPGDYIFICAVPGHAQAGMVGTLTVTN
ncbi:MAG: multicopper oxidase domain-containing protein [Chloroflexi bacterium]|nr:multicopper oxidase domain-containing protein [Chloroflexota bacterium]